MNLVNRRLLVLFLDSSASHSAPSRLERNLDWSGRRGRTDRGDSVSGSRSLRVLRECHRRRRGPWGVVGVPLMSLSSPFYLSNCSLSEGVPSSLLKLDVRLWLCRWYPCETTPSPQHWRWRTSDCLICRSLGEYNFVLLSSFNSYIPVPFSSYTFYSKWNCKLGFMTL